MSAFMNNKHAKRFYARAHVIVLVVRIATLLFATSF